MPPPESSRYHLLVEGVDDKHSIIHLLARHGFNWDDPETTRPFIAAKEGINELLAALPIAAKGSYDRLGVVLDADSVVVDRWAQVRNRLATVGVDVPQNPEPNGTVVAGLRPGTRIGVWLMPDNNQGGTLETFLAMLVPAMDPTWSFADEVAVEARRRGAPSHAADHAKAQLHTWLLSLE